MCDTTWCRWSRACMMSLISVHLHGRAKVMASEEEKREDSTKWGTWTVVRKPKDVYLCPGSLVAGSKYTGKLYRPGTNWKNQLQRNGGYKKFKIKAWIMNLEGILYEYFGIQEPFKPWCLLVAISSDRRLKNSTEQEVLTYNAYSES